MSWLSQLGIGNVVNTQQIASTSSSLITSIVYFLVFLLIIGILGIVAWLIIRNLKYNNKIVILKKVNGRVERVGKDKAIEIKYNVLGDTAFLLQKRKKYLPVPTMQSGRKEYTFYIREDGEWINVDYPDIDSDMRKIGIHFIDSDLRFARTAMYKNLKDRYDKPKFLEKYAGIIVNAIAIIIIVIGMIFLQSQMAKTSNSVNVGVDSSNKLMDKAASILSSLDNICTNGRVTTVPVATNSSGG